MHISFLIYFNNLSCTCSNRVAIHHHQQAVTVYEAYGIYRACTLAFALQLRKKHRKTSVRVAEEHPENKQTKNKTKKNPPKGKLLTLRKQNPAPTSGVFHS